MLYGSENIVILTCAGLWYGNGSVKPFWLKGFGLLASSEIL